VKRTLSLHRETLADLTAEDLGTVVGAVSGLVCLPPRTAYSIPECTLPMRSLNCVTLQYC
jgi:hypothetical protein